MAYSRRDFLRILGSQLGGWAFVMTDPGYLRDLARSLTQMGNMHEGDDRNGIEEPDPSDSVADHRKLRSSSREDSQENEFTTSSGGEDLLEKIGYFPEISPETFVFDENKYSPAKRNLNPSEWSRTNRHLPVKIDPSVINKPGERSPQAVKKVVAYIPFHSPRYVAASGERVTMCNIAAWDWSRALQLHLPHWIGETEMSANMLYRWISNQQAGGIYGEGWQSVKADAAQILANRGVPVFALAENTLPGRHGHVAMVYPENQLSLSDQNDGGPYFATVNNGRSRSGNGIKSIGSTFRRLRPTYFVHKHDFVLHREI